MIDLLEVSDYYIFNEFRKKNNLKYTSLERRERRGMEIEIEEAEKKRRTFKDEAREVKNKDR